MDSRSNTEMGNEQLMGSKIVQDNLAPDITSQPSTVTDILVIKSSLENLLRFFIRFIHFSLYVNVLSVCMSEHV